MDGTDRPSTVESLDSRQEACLLWYASVRDLIQGSDAKGILWVVLNMGEKGSTEALDTDFCTQGQPFQFET